MTRGGAALHRRLLALAHLGVPTTTESFPDPEDRTLLAVVRADDGPVHNDDATLAGWIDDRRSDRHVLRDEPVQQAELDLLTTNAATENALRSMLLA